MAAPIPQSSERPSFFALDDTVEIFSMILELGLVPQEKADLVAFMRALERKRFAKERRNRSGPYTTPRTLAALRTSAVSTAMSAPKRPAPAHRACSEVTLMTMADEISRVEYYVVAIPRKAGEGARVLTAFKDVGMNLVGCLG